MATTTVLTEHGEVTVEARIAAGRATVDAVDLESALGWALRPEGLCRGDLCVPVNDPAAIRSGERFDLAAVAGLLGSVVTIAADEAVVAIGVSAARRGEALVDRRAPDFELPDIEGVPRGLTDWDGRRRLLVAFATW